MKRDNKFKTFYKSKIGKSILFFGFYVIFFVILFTFINSVRGENPVTDNGQETNENYYYEIEVNNNDTITTFKGHIEDTNNDIENFDNKYFLNVYNVKQIIKHAKLLSSTETVNEYEIKSSELQELSKQSFVLEIDAVNNIIVTSDNNTNTVIVSLNLDNYMHNYNKLVNKYRIILKYSIDEVNK